MSFLSRVAALATLTLSVAGLITPGSAVQAAELAHSALAAPTVVSMNLPTAVEVPAPIDKIVVSQPAPRIVSADLQDGDTVAYPTLAAAVAAQTVSSDADEQLRCLATSIYYEAKGEPLAGQLAVAEVILNRAKAKRFGDGVCGVVRQPGQFSFVRGGQIPSVDASRPAYRTALAIAKVAMADVWDSPAENALYFHARRVSTGWSRTRIASIGNHIFYR